ncbi:uridine-cytidine kinase 2-B [Basidiobolus meristosporus CBS 931.73]|uniref:uridine/cytidine kinase n=1 Tax=Basidiobolus meristosporus CBS 931.73 TaxID=1314790 RepID=A0A1Y1Y0T3_9FUNG|nr:uridine-cytidine kinase 2-B [Basidiobolus meristosporus CBS 931.73]|eukprot:ORX91621.1 uridine-cytidine kinase 2-B [Basidiobolus meristosporus CBS 931.73]
MSTLESYRSPGLRPYSPADLAPVPDQFTSDKRVPFIIGVAGGPGAGKRVVCERVVEHLKATASQTHKVVILTLTQFMREFEGEELEAAKSGHLNMDHPDAFDFDLLKSVLKSLSRGEPVKIPIYDSENFKRKEETLDWNEAPDVVLIQGCLILFDAEVREYLSMKIFADVDSDTRLVKLVKTQLAKPEYNLDKTLHEYARVGKPTFEAFIFPTKKCADVIMPRGSGNHVAISLITEHIKDLLSGNTSCLHYADKSAIVSDIFDKPKKIYNPIPE